jgi:vacuolar protein sorting-associated protein IST1
MFSSGPNYSKLKTNLRLAVNRLKLLEKKKTELALKARKEIADYIGDGKAERARIRVEHIIVRHNFKFNCCVVLENVRRNVFNVELMDFVCREKTIW